MIAWRAAATALRGLQGSCAERDAPPLRWSGRTAAGNPGFGERSEGRGCGVLTVGPLGPGNPMLPGSPLAPAGPIGPGLPSIPGRP